PNGCRDDLVDQRVQGGQAQRLHHLRDVVGVRADVAGRERGRKRQLDGHARRYSADSLRNSWYASASISALASSGLDSSIWIIQPSSNGSSLTFWGASAR